MNDFKTGFLFTKQSPVFDLSAYKKEVSLCRNCNLGYSRTQVVIGEGNLKAKLMIIGEGPGDQEDREGRPFVGRAGELLTQTLSRIDLSRDKVWITNLVRCRAFDLMDFKKINRPPKPEEIAACLSFLEQEIQGINPQIIVALGSPSATTLLGKNFRTITNDRGKWSSYKEIKVLPTFHPAYVLRQKGKGFDLTYELFLADLQTARQALYAENDSDKLNLPLFNK